MQRKLGLLIGCGALSFYAFALCGCSGKYVIVKDEKGNPIQGAEVWATALSTGAGPNLTNKKGFAHVPFCVQGARWISVDKKGYLPSVFDAPQKNRIEVILRTEDSAKSDWLYDYLLTSPEPIE